MSRNIVEDRGRLTPARARVGIVIPTSNRMIEPQFQHFAPPDLRIHFARARMTGRWEKPLAELKLEILREAVSLADVKPDLLVLNCAATSMKGGPEGEAKLLNAIREETGITAFSTATAVVAALKALGLRKLVLVTPYIQATNDHEIRYLSAFGLSVLRDVALGLRNGDHFIDVSPERWVETALANDHAEADGFFLSCTNTTQIEAIEAVEKASGKPVVSANQAVLWACVNKLRQALSEGSLRALPGRLRGVVTQLEMAAG